MKQIEVEHRGIITEKKFNELKSFFHKNGKFLGEKERFSIIYFQSKSKNSEDRKDDLIDLKLRITDGKTELVMKYGKCSGSDSRKEFLFEIDSEKFDQMVEFLEILGFRHGVLQATTTHTFLYKQIEFALVTVPNWGYYFEAEIVTDKKSVKTADARIYKQCSDLGLKVPDEDAFWKLLDSLNSRDGFKFDLEHQDFSQIKKRFQDYF